MHALYLVPKNLDLLTREFQTDILTYYGDQNTFDQNTFLLISKILKPLILIPATAGTVEKAHFLLKFVKNDPRSTMLEGRMNALMLFHIHNDLCLNYDQVIDEFARRSPRKMLLVNPLESRILIPLANMLSI